MNSKITDNLFMHPDKRILDRNYGKGIVTEVEMKGFLKTLPDSADSAQYVQMDLHDAEISEGSPESDSEGGA